MGVAMANIEQDLLYDLHNYNASLKNREIFLHNHYGASDENPGVEYRMSNAFLKNIRALDTLNNNPILIHMHSIGGEWADGMVIYDAIINCHSYVTILAYGQVESMSSIIFQAADLRLMMPNSYFMSHFGSSNAAADYLNVQNWVKYEKYLCDTMMKIYAEKCIKGKYFKDKFKESNSIDKVKKFLFNKLKDGDWYLNAEDTVFYGFADGVLSSRKYPDIVTVKQMPE